MPGPVMGPPPHSGKRTHLGLPLEGGPSLTLTCVCCGRGQTWPLAPQSLLFSFRAVQALGIKDAWHVVQGLGLAPLLNVWGLWYLSLLGFLSPQL